VVCPRTGRRGRREREKKGKENEEKMAEGTRGQVQVLEEV
jgi:hypothetical protein